MWDGGGGERPPCLDQIVKDFGLKINKGKYYQHRADDIRVKSKASRGKRHAETFRMSDIISSSLKWFEHGAK